MEALHDALPLDCEVIAEAVTSGGYLSDALLPGQFPEALRVYMEMVKSRKGDVSDMTLAMLHDIRMATLD